MVCIPGIPGSRRRPSTAKKAANEIEDAILRRQHLVRAVAASGGAGVLSCHLLYQARETRDALIEAAVASLGLREHATSRP